MDPRLIVEDDGKIVVVTEEDCLGAVDISNTFYPQEVPPPNLNLPVPNAGAINPAIRTAMKWFDLEQRIASREAHAEEGHISFYDSFIGIPPFYEFTTEEVKGWHGKPSILSPRARFEPVDVLSETYRLGGKMQVFHRHGQVNTFWEQLHPDFWEGEFGWVEVKGGDTTTHAFGFLMDGKGQFTQAARYIWSFDFKRIFIVGLALDYCVLVTILEALKLGLEVVLVLDGTRAVMPDGYAKTIDFLRTQPGVSFVYAGNIRR